MKKTLKVFLGLALALSMFSSVIPGTKAVSVMAKEKPGSHGFVYLIDSNYNLVCPVDFSNTFKTTKVKGISYNKKTNTLTFNGLKKPDYKVMMQEMGDLTLVLKGTNKVCSVNFDFYSTGKQNTLTIKGSGKLVCNSKKGKIQREGFIRVGSTNGKLTIAKTVKMDIKNKSGEAAITVYRRQGTQKDKVSKFISISGKHSSGSLKWYPMYADRRWSKNTFTKNGK